MKKFIAGILFLSLFIYGFTNNKENESLESIQQSSLEKGKKLFNSKTCSTCHQEKSKVIGPSLKDIAVKYKAKKGNIVSFLQGKSKPIVDLKPGQIAVMNASLSITKAMKKEDLEAISSYIMSIK